MKHLILGTLLAFTAQVFAELKPLEDALLGNHFAQLDQGGLESDIGLAVPDSSAVLTPLKMDSRSLLNSTPASAGITMDIDLQLYIDQISWVDIDGAGPSGTQGSVTLKGLSVGHLDDINNPQAAVIRGITFDVDGRDGIAIGIEQIGDQFGNGIDINIDSIQIK